MTTLKAVNITNLIKNIDDINNSFKSLKDLLKKEILYNNGLIENRFNQYDSLFNELKKSCILNKSYMENDDLENLNNKELEIFCKKVGISEDIYIKHQIIIQKIEKFNLFNYIEEIKKNIK